MQITDNKQNKPTAKAINSKLWLVYVMLILGVGILVALYINFQLTYKFNGISQKISELDNSSNKMTNFSKNSYPIQEKTESIEQQIDNPPEVKNSKLTSCLSFYEFVQDFYLMKLDAEKGNDFTAQVLELNKYTFLSSDLKQYIDNLLNLAPDNKEISYFKLVFNNLIRDLYKDHHDANIFNIRNYIFIRATGEKALANGGLDRQVALIQNALEKNNLQEVDKYLQALPQDIESLNNFKLDVQNQLAIWNSLYKIELILLNKQSDNVVSK